MSFSLLPDLYRGRACPSRRIACAAAGPFPIAKLTIVYCAVGPAIEDARATKAARARHHPLTRADRSRTARNAPGTALAIYTFFTGSYRNVLILLRLRTCSNFGSRRV